MQRKLLLIFIAILLVANVVPFQTVHAASGTTLVVNGKSTSLEGNIVIKDGVSYAPFREIFEALGATVTWIQEQQKAVGKTNSRQLGVTIGKSTASLTLGSTTTTINIKPPYLENNKTYVPIRDVAEALGFEVRWDQQTKTIYVNVIPVVFVHGLNGSSGTFQDAISNFSNEFSQITHKITIASNGTLSAQKLVSGNVTSPLITIEFKDASASFYNQGVWINRSAEYISKEFGANKMDFVTHSMGGVAVTKHIVDTNGRYVNRLVTLGSPINGSPAGTAADLLLTYTDLRVLSLVVNTNAYRDLSLGSVALQDIYSKRGSFPSHIKVFSYAGKIYNTSSDGVVSVKSAFYLQNYTNNISCKRAIDVSHTNLQKNASVLSDVKKWLAGDPNINGDGCSLYTAEKLFN
ncbi:stalk domain-containing protein [Peribacillus loiseleuriae]|uniref:stalk domain-containing protein n=1 Tax=Peribacillus loiseleuriae TaxID=1679170 RepID=UPI003D0085DA